MKVGQMHSKRQKSARGSLTFILLSSMSMLSCLVNPLFELVVAIKRHLGETDFIANTIILDSVLWNLTTIAYTVNTMVGVMYSSK